MTTYLYVTNGDPVTIGRRGGPVFERWQQEGRDVYIESGVRGEFGHRGVSSHNLQIFVQCPASAEMADWVGRVASCNRCAVVVDVQFPIMVPDAIQAIYPDEGGEAVRFWLDSTNRLNAFDAMRVADAVTTPRLAFDGASGHFGDLVTRSRRTAILRDVDVVGAEAFGRSLETLWDRILKDKQEAARRGSSTQPI